MESKKTARLDFLARNANGIIARSRSLRASAACVTVANGAHSGGIGACLDSLIIQWFRCVGKRVDASVRPLTLPVGENSTGKSTFLGRVGNAAFARQFEGCQQGV